MFMVKMRSKRSPERSARELCSWLKLDLAEVCGDVQPELLWQERPEAKSQQLKCPMWVCKEVLNRGVAMHLLQLHREGP